MQDKKQNNNVSNKLEAMLSVPASIPFNSAAVWLRLEAAMHPAKKKRNFLWLYAAASMIIIMLSWFLLQKNEKQFLSKAMPASTPVIIKPELLSKVNGQEQRVIANKTNEQKRIAAIKNKKAVSSPENKTAFVTSINELPAVLLPPDIIVSNEVHTKVETTVAASISVKKKLRVMHVNEMGTVVNISEEKNTGSNSSMLMFNKTVTNPEPPATEEDYAAPVKKRSIFKTATGLQDNQ